jgi:hypothetical protein
VFRGAARRILLGVIEAHRRRSSDASSQARFGAVRFIHRLGASLNRPVHDHCCIIDGVFEALEEAGDIPQSVRVRPAAELTPQALAAMAEQDRERVQRWFARGGLIEPEDVRERLAWENSGFSRDAAVRVGAHDRAGLERLDDERVVGRLPKPLRDGTTALTRTPLERIDPLAALIPPPRRHRHRYPGVPAPNAPRRAAAIAFGREVADATGSPSAVRSPPRAPTSNACSLARDRMGHAAGSAVRVSAPGLFQRRRAHAPHRLHHRGRARRADPLGGR